MAMGQATHGLGAMLHLSSEVRLATVTNPVKVKCRANILKHLVRRQTSSSVICKEYLN